MVQGHSVSKILEIENKRNEIINVKLQGNEEFKTSKNFLEQINVKIDEVAGTNKFNNTLENFFSISDINLGDVGNLAKQYAITTTFQPQAGNEYQNNKVVFEIEMTITGEDGKEIDIDDNDKDDEKKDEPTPTGITPTSPPTTDAVNTVDTIDTVDEDVDTTGAIAGIMTVFDRFLQPESEVLGIEEKNYFEDLTPEGEVAGVTTILCPFWWIVLIAQTIILALLYYLLKRHKNKSKRWWLVTAGVVLLAFLVDLYAHTHWFVPSNMCRYTLILAILLALLETGLLDLISKKQAEQN